MDLLTHAVLGATAGMAVAPRDLLRRGALVGALAGVLPDADVLIASAQDPFLVLEYHRHFSHSLVLAPAIAALAAAIVAGASALRPILRSTLRPTLRRNPDGAAARAPFALLWRMALPAAFLAGLLDACTSYGTHLLWPFKDDPIAWSTIAVVDPLFTLMVVVPALIAFTRKRRRGALVALVLGALYLAFGAVQHGRALDAARALAVERGLDPAEVAVKPTLANLVLWRALSIDGGHLHADAVRVGLGRAVRIYTGERAPLVGPADAPDWAPAGSVAARDIERFRGFARGLLVRDPRAPEHLGDARYAMSPTSLTPLWSIGPPIMGTAGSSTSGHATFTVRREIDAEGRAALLDMLRGR